MKLSTNFVKDDVDIAVDVRSSILVYQVIQFDFPLNLVAQPYASPMIPPAQIDLRTPLTTTDVLRWNYASNIGVAITTTQL